VWPSRHYQGLYLTYLLCIMVCDLVDTIKVSISQIFYRLWVHDSLDIVNVWTSLLSHNGVWPSRHYQGLYLTYLLSDNDVWPSRHYQGLDLTYFYHITVRDPFDIVMVSTLYIFYYITVCDPLDTSKVLTSHICIT